MNASTVRNIRVSLLATGERGVIFGVVERVSTGRRTTDRLLMRGYLKDVVLTDSAVELGHLVHELADAIWAD